ncbi:MAG: SLC13 family permease [Thiolinea sp.]
MNQHQLTLSILLLLSLLMFSWGRWRHDLVAMSTLMSAILLGIVSADDAFSGFGHPAVVTVAAVLIISHGLNNAGVVELVSEQIRRYQLSKTTLLFTLTALVALFSAFMNNVGALALMLPVAMTAANEYKVSPAMLLMPLAFGSILGGLMTLIGTPPNIIIANYRAEMTGAPFEMFDFAPVGVLVTIIGVLFISFIGWKLIPAARLKKNTTKQLFQIDNYLTELLVPADSALIGRNINEIEMFQTHKIDVVGVATRRSYARPPEDLHILQEGEILLVRCDPQGIRKLQDKYDVELLTTATEVFQQPDIHNGIMRECVVSKNSSLVGRDVRYLRRMTGNSMALIGIARSGYTVVKRLRSQVFQPGDVLLLWGSHDTMEQHFHTLMLLPLEQRELNLEHSSRPLLAVLVFALAIILGMQNVVSLPVAFVLVIMAYVALGLIRVREIYEQVDWSVIVLLAAMLPVGSALEKTGTTRLMVENVLAATGDVAPVIILTVILILAMLISAIINNAATALVMAPIAYELAHELGANPDTFLMAVAIGSSCAFLTPIGHQSNTLVMGPGGYYFGDYWRMGLPLEILIAITSIPLLLLFFPL